MLYNRLGKIKKGCILTVTKTGFNRIMYE